MGRRESTLAGAVEALLGEERGSAPEDPHALGDWLSERGLIRVAVADPAGFVMAGRFLARFAEGWAVMFGVPPGPIFDPAGVAADGPPLEVSVLVPLEVTPARRAHRPETSGTVEAIGIADAAEGPMRSVPSAIAVAGRGLEGDRYAIGAGTFSTGGSGRDLTLVEAEAIAELNAGGTALEALEARRNLVVSGIELDALIGRRFRVGEVECRGARRCEPCAHLQRLTVPGALRGLVHRGGLRADLISAGEIRVGDEVEALD